MMSRYSRPAALILLGLGAAACQTTAGASATADAGAGIAANETTKKDAGNGDATAAADVAAKSGALGEVCQGDAQCGSGICSTGACVKSCAVVTDCAKGEDCTSDNGVRTFCSKPAYPAGAGAPCGAGTCGDGPDLKCLPSIESGKAVCAAQCTGDIDCPVNESCTDLGTKGATKGLWCRPRAFCAPCVLDAQCGTGGLCVKMDGASDVRFCSYACNAGSGECPAYAACAQVDDAGNYACIHKAGTCKGEGALCNPCSEQDDNCNDGGVCRTFIATGESFCTAACDASGGCPTSAYSCEKIGSGSTAVSECVPTKAQCVKKLGAILKGKTAKYAGDVLPDFPMVGYFDDTANFDLLDEDVQLLHLSDFAKGGKYGDRGITKILFTVSAGWCKYCREETAQFKTMLKAGQAKGLLIYQVLYDGMEAPSLPTLKFLVADWIKPLKAQGAVGIDPDKDTSKWIGDGPPLNILIDAETRRIIVKINGSPTQGMAAWLADYL